MSAERWALISVYNKKGVVEFAQRLVKLGWRIISSGGTAKALTEAGVPVKDVAELVGGGPILGHRVVTLSRQVHAALLADLKKPADIAELEGLNIPIIGMVVCDFYPLAMAIAKLGATIDSVVDMTDIGGPCMVRSAAKGGRIVICRMQDREYILHILETQGEVPAETIQSLRAIAEFEVATYVATSAIFHGNGQFNGILGQKAVGIPKGENGPQSPAGLFSTGNDDPLALDKILLLEGAPLGYCNWTDIDRLLQTLTHIVAIFQTNFGTIPRIAVAVKHGNPCGAAVGDREEVVRAVVKGDSLAVFGGWVMTNFPINEELAEIMVTAGMKKGKVQKFDGIVAPAFTEGVGAFFERKGGRCRLMISHALADCASLDTTPRLRQVRGGFIVQPNYTYIPNLVDHKALAFEDKPKNFDRIVTDLALAWAVCATSNSNTITIVKNGMLIGNGVGQQARVWAAKLAVMRARDAKHAGMLRGAVACSDSFFPYTDAVKILIDAGITAIFSTSGSKIGDEKVQALCERNGVLLLQLPDIEARGFFAH